MFEIQCLLYKIAEMNGYLKTIYSKFRDLWGYYLLQSVLAGLAVLLIVVVFTTEREVVISSLGATVFICFAMPKAVSAQTKHVIGGHAVGLLCGAIFTLTHFNGYIEFPLAVGLAVFLMVALDVEHPPAAGTALAVAINEVHWGTAIGLMVSVVVIAALKHLLRRWMKDLV